MSFGGPYSGYQDQPPAGWPTHEQQLWARPWEDGLDDYYEYRDEREPVTRLHGFTSVSSGQALGGLEAPPATTRTPEAGCSPSSGPARARAHLDPLA